MATATATQVQKGFGAYIDKALREPVTITRHNRETVVMLSAETYKQMQAVLAKALYAHEVPDEVARLIEDAEYGR